MEFGNASLSWLFPLVVQVVTALVAEALIACNSLGGTEEAAAFFQVEMETNRMREEYFWDQQDTHTLIIDVDVPD